MVAEQSGNRLEGIRALGLLILLALVFVQALPRLLSLPGPDESLWFMRSLQASRGALPYQDFFLHLFPLSIWLGALGIRILGPTVVGLRMVLWIVLGATAFITLDMGKSFLKPWGRWLLAGILWLLVINNCCYISHHTVSGILSAWLAWCVVRALRDGNERFLVFAGLVCGLILLTTQHTGLLLLGSTAAFLFVQKSRLAVNRASWPEAARFTLLKFVAPTLGIVGLGLLVLHGQGILKPALSDSVFWLTAGHYNRTTTFDYFSTGFHEMYVNLVIPTPGGPVTNWPGLPFALQILLMGWLPVFGMLWAACALIRQRAEARDTTYQLILFLLVHTLATSISTLSYSFTIHIALMGWTGYLLAVQAVQEMTGKNRNVQRVLLGASVVYAIVLSALYLLSLNDALSDPKMKIRSYGTLEQSFISFEGPAAVMKTNILTELIRQNIRPDQRLFVFNTTPQLYFLSDRTPATRYMWTLPVLLSETQERELVASLERERLPLIIYDHVDESLLQTDPRFRPYRDVHPRLNRLFDFLNRQYSAIPVDPAWTLYRLRPPLPGRVKS